MSETQKKAQKRKLSHKPVVQRITHFTDSIQKGYYNICWLINKNRESFLLLSTMFAFKSVIVFNHSAAHIPLMGVKNGNYGGWNTCHSLYQLRQMRGFESPLRLPSYHFSSFHEKRGNVMGFHFPHFNEG